jgi:hypothetical protein
MYVKYGSQKNKKLYSSILPKKLVRAKKEDEIFE